MTQARNREGAAIDGEDRSVAYEYDELVTDAWKAGTCSATAASDQALASRSSPTGPRSRPRCARGDSPPERPSTLVGPDAVVSARALVAPPGEYETAPGCSRLAYGDPPDRPEVASFERERWSENPIAPPGDRSPDDEALRSEGVGHTHRALPGTVRAIAADHGLESGDRVGASASLETVGGFLGGVLVSARGRRDDPV